MKTKTVQCETCANKINFTDNGGYLFCDECKENGVAASYEEAMRRVDLLLDEQSRKHDDRSRIWEYWGQ